MDLVHILGGFFLLAAALFDLNSREVPDWLSFSLVAIGLVSSFFYALTVGDWWVFLRSVLGFLVCVAVGLLMFYSSQWGGGDAKLVMGIGAVLGLSWSKWPLLVMFLVWTMLAGALYGIGYGFFLMGANWKSFKAGFAEFVRLPKIVYARRLVIALAAFLLMFSFWLPSQLRFFVWVLIALSLLGYYLILVMKVIEKVCLIKELPVSRLTEGDWVYKDVVVRGKRICSKKDLGVSLEQIAQLKKLKVKKVWVKEGVPFVPTFFVAYVLALWKGAWFLTWFF